MRKLYPIFLDMEGIKAVVIGGGPVAARKAAALAASGASVTVISPELDPRTAALVQNGGVTHINRCYMDGDLAEASLAVAATDDPETNMKVASDAKARGILINCVRPPVAGNFIVPSSIRRGGLTVAVSTGGGCPALSKMLRLELETMLGREYEPFLEFLDNARTALKLRLSDEGSRAQALTALVDSDLLELFRTGSREEAAERGLAVLEKLISRLEKRA